MQAGGHRWSDLVTLALTVVLAVCGVRGCWTGSGSECEKAPLVPGHNLAGEGFDVVRMSRTGAYVINVKAHLADNNNICTLCLNRFQNEQIQRLPAAVLDWRTDSYCSKQLSSALHHSVESRLRSSNSLMTNDWNVGLNLDNYGTVAIGGSRSDLAKFALSQHRVDKATFSIQEISCTFYSYRMADKPKLSSEFTDYLKRLPRILNIWSKVLYKRLINTYGTHYIRQVQLGGKVRQITAFRTCLATLKGFSESEMNDCLKIELQISLGFIPANAFFSNKCETILKRNMSMGFYQGFLNHKMEVIGGDKYFPHVLYQGPSHKYYSWMNSLHNNPDVVSYDITPLDELVDDLQVRDNLRSVITDYINQNRLQEQSASKKCSPTLNLDHNCCPLRAGRGNLRVKIERATGLFTDWFNEADAYVKIFYDDMYGETDTVMNNNNPVWNDIHDYGSVDLGQKFRVEVWDSDYLFDEMAGSCYTYPQRGTYSMRCQLSYGVLYYTYSVKCDPHLTGHNCGLYSPIAEQLYHHHI